MTDQKTEEAKTLPAGMVIVTRDEFFAYVMAASFDIVPRSEADYTAWETRARELVGWTVPGWKNPADPKTYMLPAPDRRRPIELGDAGRLT